jgi:APA family basic amino acid/polyamine antiporter
MNELKKKYGLITAICMVVGIVIGSGVFFKATPVFTNNGGNMVNSILTVLTVGALTSTCAYTFSILAGKHSRVNGLVDYAEAQVGEGLAYTLGWFISVIYYPVVASTLAWVSANYTCSLFGINNADIRLLITASYLTLSFLLNVISPRLSGRLQVSTTVIKLIPLIIMATVGTVVGIVNGQTLANLTANTAAISQGSGSFFGAVVAFAFAYEGWIIATCINAELHNAKRNLPRALIVGTVIVISVYIAYFIGIASVLSTKEIMEAGDTLPKIAFTRLFGGNEIFGTIAYVFIIISCLGTMNGVMLGNCRGLFSLAVRNQGPAPKKLAKIHDKFNMPVISSIIGFTITIIWMLQWEFGLIRGKLPAIIGWENDELPIITLYALYIPIFVSMMIKSKDLHPVKRFVFPALSIASCLFMIFCAFYAYKIQAVYYLIIFALIMTVGLMFYRDSKGRSMIYKFFYK